MRIVKLLLGLDYLLLQRISLLYLYRVISLLYRLWYPSIVYRLKVLFPALAILVNF